jgi:inner membrane protein
LLIAVLTIVMGVPLFLIDVALWDRQDRAGEAASDVGSGWGGPQTVAGPMLVVPYQYTTQSTVDGRTVQTTSQSEAVILPAALTMRAKVDTSTRWRGIFPVPVYRGAIGMDAQFDKQTIAAGLPTDSKILWDQAQIVILVSDPHGLAENVFIDANGRKLAFEPGLSASAANVGGIHADFPLDKIPESLTLHTTLALHGSRELNLAPLGRQTEAQMQSGWRDPSFSGAFLPTDRSISSAGFTANWTIPYLARGFAQSFSSLPLAVQAVQTSDLGVKFYQPVDLYQMVARSLKYAVLFVGLAFLIFFITELLTGAGLHPVQYALIGLAQVLFYLLLLSFAEHVGFTLAYVVAAAATLAMTTLYASTVLGNVSRAGILAGLLAALYGLLYVILIQEDYALLVGAVVLFCSLGATMFATRRIDWSSTSARAA